MDEMEKTLHACRSQQYTTNLKKRIINELPKFKEGDLVRYLLRRKKFSKEDTLNGSWTREIYRILRVHRAHSFKPMHTYTLCKLNTTVPIPGLPSLPENQIKKATITSRQTFPIKRILKKRKIKYSSSGKITTCQPGNRDDIIMAKRKSRRKGGVLNFF